jgi:WD40 repeat protein
VVDLEATGEEKVRRLPPTTNRYSKRPGRKYKPWRKDYRKSWLVAPLMHRMQTGTAAASIIALQCDPSGSLMPLPKNNLKELFALSCHTDIISCLAFDPEGGLALSGSHDGAANLLDLADGRVMHCFSHVAPIRAVSFAEKGRQVVTFSDDKIVHVWDTRSFKKVEDFPVLGPRTEYRRGVLGRKYPTCVAFSPDGNHVLVGCQDKVIYLLPMSPGARSRRMVGHELPVFGVGFVGAGRLIFSFSQWPDTTLKLWDTSDRKEIQSLEHKDHIFGAAVSADGRFAVVGLSNGKILIWNALNGELLFKLASGFFIRGGISSLDFHKDNRWILSGSSAGSLRLWDIEKRKPLGNTKAHQGSVSRAIFSPCGRFALSCGFNDATVKYWEMTE